MINDIAVEQIAQKFGANARVSHFGHPYGERPLHHWGHTPWIAVTVAVVLSLLATCAIRSMPDTKGSMVVKPTLVTPNRFTAAWSAVQPSQSDLAIRQIAITKALTAPKPVVTERIVLDAPPTEPPVVFPSDEEDRPAVRQSQRHASNDGDICTRHRMHKVWTPDGRSWHCRR